jgi:thioredoxin reductase
VEELRGCRFYGNWTGDLNVFTDGQLDVPEDVADALRGWGVRLETSRMQALLGEEGKLTEVELADGRTVACEAIFVHPEQRQAAVVERLGLELNDGGFVVVPKDSGEPVESCRVMETSVPGVFAAGDMTSPAQSAVMATYVGALAGQTILMSLLGV